MAAMAILDVFKADAFSMISLTDAVNKIPFSPSRISRMGLFESKGVTTTSIEVEEQSGSLTLIPDTLRGAPSNQNKHGKRTVRTFKIPHFPLEDTILASEVQDVRSFGGTQLQGIQEVVNGRLAEMIRKHDATLEYGRIGALKGIITDANGTDVLYNLFTEFGVTQTSIDFALGTSTTSVKSKILEAVRAIEDELGDAVYDHVHCFCGKTWFDKFVQHPNVEKAYLSYLEGGKTISSDNRKGFEFAGVIFEEYRGKVGGVAFVADAEAHFFPVGVPGMYVSRFAPADMIDTANTVGLPRYARQAVDTEFYRFVKLLTESNPISLCTRPKALVKATTSN